MCQDAFADTASSPIHHRLRLTPSADNPRNSEGDFMTLHDGRIMFIYSHFTGSSSDDSAPAHLAARFSSDGGRTWSSEDATVFADQGGRNVMSASLVRLLDGRIALFYLSKQSINDCRPMVRFSSDEGATWSAATPVIAKKWMGYYVLNNDRVIQLKQGEHRGRLVVPVSQHNDPQWQHFTPHGHITCYLSDDNGQTWRRSKTVLDGQSPAVRKVVLEEPGVVQLNDGRLMLFIRTDAGSQYLSFSSDAGNTWSRPRASQIISPRSPASIERIPHTGDLMMVWNDHQDVPPAIKEKRTPLCIAISTDSGKSWQHEVTLENDPRGWYCYTAIHVSEGHVLLAYTTGHTHLRTTGITSFPLDWLYKQ